jgi:hypothetical protein
MKSLEQLTTKIIDTVFHLTAQSPPDGLLMDKLYAVNHPSDRLEAVSRNLAESQNSIRN